MRAQKVVQLPYLGLAACVTRLEGEICYLSEKL
jgi:hypothetical protein